MTCGNFSWLCCSQRTCWDWVALSAPPFIPWRKTWFSHQNFSWKLGFTSYLLKLHFILSLATIHIPQLAWVWDMGEAVHVEFPRPRPRPLPLGLLRGHGGQLRDKISTDPWSRGFPRSRTCQSCFHPEASECDVWNSLYSFLTRWWRALSFDRGRNRATAPYY